MKPIIAVSTGDFNGVGPEVVIKSMIKTDLDRSIPFLIGSAAVFDFYNALLKTGLELNAVEDIRDAREGVVNLFDPFGDEQFDIQPGALSGRSGSYSMRAVETGITLNLSRNCHALVTAPVSKEAIQKGGYDVPGHTEFLAQKTNTSRFLMILAANGLRVGLATGHIPVKSVSGTLSGQMIVEKAEILNQSLIEDFGILNPQIAVFGLNPHSGDGGVIGREEIEIISPAIEECKKRGIGTKGPFAADGFFGNRLQDKFDAMLAMYHDQGLIPFKALTFGQGVNFTAGLPIIRTSPDHGTAFNIAGLNKADESSFTSAYELAVDMALNRFDF